MLQSKLFGKTRRESPKDEVSKNAQLLIRAGFIDKASAGVYSYLPLGLRVLRKIEKIIREEIEAIGGQEALFPILMTKDLWEKTGRYNIDILFKLKDRSNKDFVLGPSHEEIITEVAAKNIFTYKDLPLAVYQIQNKFRDEPRPKAGLMRTKEFIMKDLYSFHENEQDLDLFYEKAKKAYLKIFKKTGLTAFSVEASGGDFTDKYSHEFMVKTKAGEDITFLCELCGWARNKEIIENSKTCPDCGGKLKQEKTVEGGNIFKLGDKYSKDLGVYFVGRDGQKKLAIMGCYGIGTGRLMGTIVEAVGDEKGIIWPDSVAPFFAHLIYLPSTDSKMDKKVKSAADKIYQSISKKGIEVLYDDRTEMSTGEKFADSDLIGIPFRIIMSERMLAKNQVEVKRRGEEKSRFISIKEIVKFLQDELGK